MSAIETLALLAVLAGISFFASRKAKKEVGSSTSFTTNDGQKIEPNKNGIWPAISGNIVAGGEDEHSAWYV